MSQRVTAAYECLDAVANPVLVLQASHIVWANAAAVALTGYTRLTLNTLSLRDLISHDESDSVSTKHEIEMHTAQGKVLWVEVTVKTTEVDGAQVEIVTINDLTAHKQLEHSFERRESTFRRIVEGSLDGFYLLRCQRDESGKILDFTFADLNARGLAMLPYAREELIGQGICELMPFHRSQGYFDKYVWVLENNTVLDEDFSLIVRDGTRRWYHHQVVPVNDGVASFTRDITERKVTENALQESEHRYRALLNQSNDCVSLLDLEGFYLVANEQIAATMGYTVEEMIGKNINDLVRPSEIESIEAVNHELIAGHIVPLFERVYRRKDGSEFLGEVNVTLVRDADDKPLYIQSIMRDITWRKEAENALRASEERYRLVSELSSDYAYAFRVEPDNTFIHEWITESFRRMTGFTHDEIDARGNTALFHPDDAKRVEADMQRVLQGETFNGEYRIVTKAGAVRWVNIYRQPLWDDDEQRVVRMYGVAQDITERKQSEEELRSSEEKYRLIAENASDMITRNRPDGIRTFISSACRTLLAYEPEELLGRSFLDIIHPEDVERVRNVFAEFQNSYEPFTFVCRSRHKNGEYIWFEITAKATHDSDSRAITEFITVARDISQRKQMDELRLEQERLRFALQKEQELNEVKNNLMRTISHEFRTPLTLIVTATDFLDRYIEHLDIERRQERLHAIHLQVKRLSDMLDDISFVVQGTLHHMTARPAHLNLEAYCRTLVEEIQTSIGKNHQFIFTTDGQLQDGIADRALIIRILGNLLSNAVKYSPENSIIMVMLYRSDNDAILQVSDQGIGIKLEEQKHIFDAFYRGASVIDTVGGTGLGLSIVKDCVDLHGGTITVESEPGKGTTFIVRLPQAID